MNQEKMAGIGNIYADEILFQAGFLPKTKLTDLNDDDLRLLARKTCHVLEIAIERRVGEKGWPGSRLLPKRSDGESCPRCGGIIRSSKASGRTAYYCSRHQK